MIHSELPDPFQIDSMFPYWREWDHASIFKGLTAPWEALDCLVDYLRKWGKDHLDEQFHPPKNAPFHCEGPVWIGPGTVIEPGAMIRGPVIIGSIVRSGIALMSGMGLSLDLIPLLGIA